MVVTWWYCISIGWFWLVLGDTGSKQGGISCQCDMLSENIWFTEQGGTGCQHEELS